MSAHRVRIIGVALGLIALTDACSKGTPRETPGAAAEPRRLQFSDADGVYPLDLPITIGHNRILGFNLVPPGFVYTEVDSTEHQRGWVCRPTTVSQDTLRLTCVAEPLGTITLRGRFLVERTADGVILPDSVHHWDGVSVAEGVITVVRGKDTVYVGTHRLHVSLGE